MLNILLIDDHTLFRELLIPTLESLDTNVVIYEAATIGAGLEILKVIQQTDLIVLDLRFPNEKAWDNFPFASRFVKPVPILILTASINRTDFEIAIKKGCKGYITKSTSKRHLITGINRILCGHTYFSTDMLAPVEDEKSPRSKQDNPLTKPFDNLSDRQNEILRHLAKGNTNREIAQLCGIAEGTVKLHVSTILKAFSVSNRTQAVIKANQFNDAPRRKLDNQ